MLKIPFTKMTGNIILSTKRPISIDLFSGAGGMGLGFEQAGFDVVAAVELDPIHCTTHEYNFPKCPMICNGVSELTGADIRKKANLGDQEIDVVFGGPPCQGFSLIGKRSLEDPRNELLADFVRLVSELNPKYFVMENVKGLTIGQQKNFLLEVIAAFEKRGYEVEKNYRVLNAKDFGVPQDRQRLFLLGCRKGLKVPSYPKEETSFVTVGDAIGDIPNCDEFKELIESDQVKIKRLTAKSEYAKKLKGYLQDSFDFSAPRNYDPSLLTSSMRTEHGKPSINRFKKTTPGKVEPVSRFFKLDLDGVCNTLRAGTPSNKGAFTAPRPIHPADGRCITVREAARIHSYPDWFRFHSTKWHGFRQIGNSVPPLLARAVASEIMKALGVKPEKPKDVLNLGNLDFLSFTMTEAAKYYGVKPEVMGARIRDEDKKNKNS